MPMMLLFHSNVDSKFHIHIIVGIILSGASVDVFLSF